MVAKVSLPPTHHHPSLTKTVPPVTAQKHISEFLLETQRKPYLHPDSLLSSSEIKYSAHSGPSGGLAIHHLRRIEAGLRGENLIAETAKELEHFEQLEQQEAENAILPAGDDARLDALLEQQEEKSSGQKLKRKRNALIAEWAEDTSSQAGGDAGAGMTQELESFANTPLHLSDWQDQEEYELQQSPLEGEIGEREGAPVVTQNGVVPRLEEHDEEGNVVERKQGRKREMHKDGTLTEAAKLARKAEKKARQAALRQEMAKKGKG